MLVGTPKQHPPITTTQPPNTNKKLVPGLAPTRINVSRPRPHECPTPNLQARIQHKIFRPESNTKYLRPEAGTQTAGVRKPPAYLAKPSRGQRPTPNLLGQRPTPNLLGQRAAPILLGQRPTHKLPVCVTHRPISQSHSEARGRHQIS